MLPGAGFAHIVSLEDDREKFIENTLEAAALCACGVPIRTLRTAREKSGAVEWRFDYHPGHAVDLRARCTAPDGGVVIHDIEVSIGSLTANQLMHAYRTGALERADPAHPFLDALRALRNRERLLRWIMAGRPAQLAKHPRCDRWQYESAPLAEIPSHMAARLWMTRELKAACALGVFGVPLVRCSGVLPDMTFELSFAGFPPSSATCQIVDDFRSGALDDREPHHPFFIAWSAIEVMQKLKRHMQSEIANVWIEKPKSKHGASAFLRADATSKARDQMRTHFRRCE